MQLVKTDTEKRFCTTAEAAKELGCGIATIYRMIDAGTLPIVRMADRALRIERSVLQKEAAARKHDQERLKQLITIPEAARQLTVSDITVRRIIKSGGLPVVRVRSNVRLDPQAVETYIKERLS